MQKSAKRTIQAAFSLETSLTLKCRAVSVQSFCLCYKRENLDAKGESKMIILITGASHTGKTLLAQKLLEKYRYPYLSIDLLKMGLIRSKNTTLTPYDDKELEDYLWPIVREIIKTAIENRQNLIVEGCYIPLRWKEDFSDAYRNEIRCYCLVMSRNYIQTHFSDIKKYANEIEQRIDDTWCTMDFVIEENERYLRMCQEHNGNMILIEDCYQIEIDG